MHTININIININICEGSRLSVIREILIFFNKFSNHS